MTANTFEGRELQHVFSGDAASSGTEDWDALGAQVAAELHLRVAHLRASLAGAAASAHYGWQDATGRRHPADFTSCPVPVCVERRADLRGSTATNAVIEASQLHRNWADVAFDPAIYEPAVDDFGNQYLARREAQAAGDQALRLRAIRDLIEDLPVSHVKTTEAAFDFLERSAVLDVLNALTGVQPAAAPPDPARAFARWFLSQPHVRQAAFIREWQGKQPAAAPRDQAGK